jgi:hypothetical protein
MKILQLEPEKVVQATKNERLLVGIVARMMNCEIILHGLGQGA